MTDSFEKLSGKLAGRVADAAAKDKDFTAAKSAVVDLDAKVADAKTKVQAVYLATSGLKPADYPGNRADLLAARTTLVDARSDLTAARADAQKVIEALTRE